MGQYYKACVLKKNWKQAKNTIEVALSSYDFKNGAKLTEHSYIGNPYVRSVEHLLSDKFKGYPFVWCGDYADKVEGAFGSHNIYDEAYEWLEKDNKNLLAKIPKVWDDKNVTPYDSIPYFKYLVNYTKKEYCVIPRHNKRVWKAHPLPLLTAFGNGRGGGDYYIEDERVGIWAFDRIGVTNNKDEILNFKKIDEFFELD